MMNYLLSGGQVVAGVIALVAWWFALKLVGRLRGDKQLSALMFAVVPCVFLLWLVAGLHPDHERHRPHLNLAARRRFPAREIVAAVNPHRG